MPIPHHSVVLLDNALRNAWFAQGRFGLSDALYVSAWKKLRDSGKPGNVKRADIPQLDFWSM
jgi:hypothetical protein